MLKSYLSIAVRSLFKNKLTTVINLLGLSAGIATCILIIQYVDFELSYENQVQANERIYRLTSKTIDAGQIVRYTTLSSSEFVKEAQSEFPQVERYTQLMSTRSWFDCTVSSTKEGQPITFNEPNFFFADSAFLNFFSYQIVDGNIATALKDPNTIVLSQSAAKRYFGDENPMGHDCIGWRNRPVRSLSGQDHRH